MRMPILMSAMICWRSWPTLCPTVSPITGMVKGTAMPTLKPASWVHPSASSLRTDGFNLGHGSPSTSRSSMVPATGKCGSSKAKSGKRRRFVLLPLGSSFKKPWRLFWPRYFRGRNKRHIVFSSLSLRVRGKNSFGSSFLALPMIREGRRSPEGGDRPLAFLLDQAGKISPEVFLFQRLGSELSG
jgi:hypothetical protein